MTSAPTNDAVDLHDGDGNRDGEQATDEHTGIIERFAISRRATLGPLTLVGLASSTIMS